MFFIWQKIIAQLFVDVAQPFRTKLATTFEVFNVIRSTVV